MNTYLLVNAANDEVIKGISALSDEKAFILSTEQQELYLKVGQFEPSWTYIESNFDFSGNVIRKLAMFLKCKIFTLVYDKNSEVIHYSEVENGKLIKAYTNALGKTEKINISLVEVFTVATTKKKFNIPSGFAPSEDNPLTASLEYFEAYPEIDFEYAFNNTKFWTTYFVKKQVYPGVIDFFLTTGSVLNKKG